MRRKIQALLTTFVFLLLTSNTAGAWQAYDCGGYWWPNPNCPGSTTPGVPDPHVPSSPNAGKISRIDINALGGMIQVPDCAIGGGNTTCQEDNFTIASYGPNCTPQSCERGCNATVVFNDGREPITGPCSISDGSGSQYATGKVTVDRTQGCIGFAIQAISDPNAKAYFIDPAGDTWVIDDLSVTATGGQPQGGGLGVTGTLWRPSTLKIGGYASNGTDSQSITMLLNGDIKSLQACFASAQAPTFT